MNTEPASSATAITATAMLPTAIPRHRTVVGARAPTADSTAGSVYAGFVNASANFAALSNRSAANFSNDFAVAAATCGGTDYRNSVTGRASSVTIFITTACADAPVWGGSPVNISYNTQPNE